MKTSITHAEYLQFIGLHALAAFHNKQLEDIKQGAYELLAINPDARPMFNDPHGHIDDCIYGSREPNEMLRILGIDVQPKPETPAAPLEPGVAGPPATVMPGSDGDAAS